MFQSVINKKAYIRWAAPSKISTFSFVWAAALLLVFTIRLDVTDPPIHRCLNIKVGQLINISSTKIQSKRKSCKCHCRLFSAPNSSRNAAPCSSLNFYTAIWIKLFALSVKALPWNCCMSWVVILLWSDGSIEQFKRVGRAKYLLLSA